MACSSIWVCLMLPHDLYIWGRNTTEKLLCSFQGIVLGGAWHQFFLLLINTEGLWTKDLESIWEERLQEQANVFFFLPEAPRVSPSHTSHARSLAIHLKYLAATSHLLSVLHMKVYICWCNSLHSSHSLPPPMCPQVHVLHLPLHSFPANRVHQYHYSGFHIYVLIDWGKGGRLMREGIYVRLWLVHIVVQQKTTQCCKS